MSRLKENIEALGVEARVEKVTEKGEIPLPLIIDAKRLAGCKEGSINSNKAKEQNDVEGRIAQMPFAKMPPECWSKIRSYSLQRQARI